MPMPNTMLGMGAKFACVDYAVFSFLLNFAFCPCHTFLSIFIQIFWIAHRMSAQKRAVSTEKIA